MINVLFSFIAILFMQSPPTRSSDEVCHPLGMKMLWEHINRADVEPSKAICGFVLYHPSDDALPDNNCGNLLQVSWDRNFLRHGSHLARPNVASPPKKIIDKTKLLEVVGDKTLNAMV